MKHNVNLFPVDRMSQQSRLQRARPCSKLTTSSTANPQYRYTEAAISLPMLSTKPSSRFLFMHSSQQ